MEKISATIFVNGRGTSIVTTKEEIIKEINHFRLFWMAGIMEKNHDGTYTAHYSNEEKTARIAIHGFTYELRKWLSMRMKG
jgi:hypothetical protein